MRDQIETYFSHNFCHQIYTAIKYKFPDIDDLDVSMDESAMVTIIFNEGKYTQKEVNDYLDELRNMKFEK